MAEDKLPGVPEKQKQEEVTKEARLDKIWFYRESSNFSSPNRLPKSKQIKFILSNFSLDVRDRLQSQLIHEFETGLAFNLIPVFLGIGILTYFTIPAEPSFAALLVTICFLVLIIQKLDEYTKLSKVLSVIATLASGMLIAQSATILNHTSIIERQTTAEMKAVILGVDQSRRGAARYFVKPIMLEGFNADTLPKRIRVSAAAKHNRMLPGDLISGLVRLQPVAGPVYPGGYDFSFFAWHEGMGGSGFFMGRPSKMDQKYSIGIGEYFLIQINKMRIAVEKRILNAMPSDTGKIAVALVTGNKTYIPDDVQESLRKTGLAHILAISGLHMALVTLTVIWGIRLGLAFIPRLALNYPIKKWAVCAGFVSATTYLMLSGGGVATQRAWVMISVMLLAVLMDRRAITMRSVAISAIIILLINPQSLLSPGFQMSFAAVTALVAGYEFLNKRRKQQAENLFVPVRQNMLLRASSGLFGYFSGIATTSLIAGTATAFIAAWHFHQVAPLGLLANLIAMPIVSILIMPFVLFSILLMPYGLEFIPLASVSYGIEWVLDVSKWVEDISPDGNTGLVQRYSILVFALFLIISCFFKTHLRLFALVPLFALPFVFTKSDMPDILVSENGRAIAVKTDKDKLALLFPRSSVFVQNIWLKAWSDGKAEVLNLSKEQCNRERCMYVMPSNEVVHIVYNPKLLKSSCNRADILIAPRLWWVNCRERQPALILKRYDFERFGTHALYIKNVSTNANSETIMDKSDISPQRITVKTALPESIRPYHRSVTHPDAMEKF